MESTALGEIHVGTLPGETTYTSLPLSSAGRRFREGVPHADDVLPLTEGIVHETAPHASDGAVCKYVSGWSKRPRLVRVGQPIDIDSPVSLGFPASAVGDAGAA